MGNFHSNARGGFRDRSRDSRGGGRGGGFGGRGGGGGFRGDRDSRRPTEMYDAICAKCGKSCQVPFKPTGEKPVYCSDCFRENEASGNSRGGGSSDQMSQINAKLDKIIKILQELELDVDEIDEEDEDLEEDEEADL